MLNLNNLEIENQQDYEPQFQVEQQLLNAVGLTYSYQAPADEEVLRK